MSRDEYTQMVGEWLRRNRVALDLTQSAVAEGIGVAESSVSNWELGRGGLSAYAHTRLKDYFKKQWAERRQAVGELPSEAQAQGARG